MVALPVWVLVIAFIGEDNKPTWMYKEKVSLEACKEEMIKLLMSQQVEHVECSLYTE